MIKVYIMVKMKMKHFLATFIYLVSPKLFFSLSYFKNRKSWPNLKNPQNFSEIIGSQIVSGEICKYSIYVDKINVRNYIKKWGLGKYLPKIYGIWKSANEIDFSKFPQKFVLKTNHGCGGHYIHTKKTINEKKIRGHMQKALEKKMPIMEPQYKKIVPFIFCEEYIDDGFFYPIDYKYECIDGEIKAILVCTDRGTKTSLSCYDVNWNKLNYLRHEYESKATISKPEKLEEMNSIAASIASYFPQVRVDLYYAKGHIYIGELTFTGEGGLVRYFTNEALVKIGH